MLLRSSANSCPSCGGCLPCEGLPHRVCRCGSDWGDSLLELIRLLDELLSDPPPPDSHRPEEDPVSAPVLSDTTEEETPDRG